MESEAALGHGHAQRQRILLQRLQWRFEAMVKIKEMAVCMYIRATLGEYLGFEAMGKNQSGFISFFFFFFFSFFIIVCQESLPIPFRGFPPPPTSICFFFSLFFFDAADHLDTRYSWKIFTKDLYSASSFSKYGIVSERLLHCWALASKKKR
jgi:hypothetical protein